MSKHRRSRLIITKIPALWIALVSVLLLGEPPLSAAGLKIQMPLETGVFAPGRHAEIANAQCLVCHSVEYVVTQPRLSRTAWKASLEKMQLKYGAQIPPEQVSPLLDYLVQHYGVENSNSIAQTSLPVPPPVRIPPVQDETLPEQRNQIALATRYGCTGCHSSNVKIVGPALKQIASKYKDDPRAAEAIAQQITHGGGGKWGSVPMPPFPAIPRSEVESLIRWILDEDRVR